MKHLSFTEKNNLVVKHTGAKHFSNDLELFKKTFPTHELYTDLARASSFTYERLDGQMLYTMLDFVSIEYILKNRNSEATTEVDPPVAKTNLLDAVNQDGEQSTTDSEGTATGYQDGEQHADDELTDIPENSKQGNEPADKDKKGTIDKKKEVNTRNSRK